MQYSEPVEIQTQPQSRNEIYGHTEHLVQNTKEAIILVLNEEQRKHGNKKEKLTESLH